MNLVECPGCGREVSRRADACPKCAHPVSMTVDGPPGAPHDLPRGRWRAWVPFASRLGVGGMLLWAGLGEENVLGIIGGAIIAGSAIPAWYRMQLERWIERRRSPEIGSDLADRLSDLEHRHQSDIAELEERIDFAERLLSTQREDSPVP